MTFRPFASLAALLLVVPAGMLPAQTPDAFRLPEGFAITPFADGTLADDIYCMTCDPAGRVVAAGRGYVRILEDTDNDGRADKALDFAGAPKDGAMGLFWEGDTLFCMGDGGLRRWTDASGKGRTRPPELLFAFKTGGEHNAHAIRRGPDGWLYVLCGNHTGIGPRHAMLPTSPVRDPIAGCVLRFAPDLKRCEIVADGFRNAYDMDFNLDGELFLYDSDNERCVSLPWYEYTRAYHVIEGGHHGWMSPQRADTWRRPPYVVDVVAPLAHLERGSPTGVECYRQRQFPERYWGGLFLADWTFGRIWFLPLERSGSTYKTKPERFLQATGTNGFAPTDLAVHPRTGDLFVSIGGRGTRGAVYRIRHPRGLAGVKPGLTPVTPRPRPVLETAAQAKVVLGEATGDNLHVRRRALQVLLAQRDKFSPGDIGKVVGSNATREDRSLRWSAAELYRTLPAFQQSELMKTLPTPWRELLRNSANPSLDIHLLLSRKGLLVERQLEAVRLLQLALGGLGGQKGAVWEGYTRHSRRLKCPPEVRARLRAVFPTGEENLDRELSRTLAMVEDDDEGVARAVAAKLTERASPVDDIHYLIVLARLEGSLSPAQTRRVARALLALDAKIEQHGLNQDRNWFLRIAELHKGLAAKAPGLNAALLAHPAFGRPGHVLFTRGMTKGQRRDAAGVFLKKSKEDTDYRWNAELIRLAGQLPADRSSPCLRELWGEQGLDEEILAVLARHPEEADRDRFVAGLGSGQMNTVRLCLGALSKLKAGTGPDAALPLIQALRRVPDEKATRPLREELAKELRRVAAMKADPPGGWAAWFQGNYPDRADALRDGVDLEAWTRRLASVDWDEGDASRGAKVFVRARCAACHEGGQRMGPDLRGVTGRFSRDDLFAAVVQPSKAVPPRYRTTYLVTGKGKIYQGMIVYEAVDSLILQTGPDQTVRLTNHEIAERRLTADSLMPAGLLDKLPDRDLADLYAYLRNLK